MAESSRYYSRAALKKLFALSHNVCAFPRCEEALARPQWPKVLAKVCHIAGLNEGSARFDPSMTVVERNDYPNLILLCPNHHDLIDELEPERFTVDDLLDMKAAHETRRPGDVDWCTEEFAESFVVKLIATQGIVVLGAGESPPRRIRSGSKMPELRVSDEERRRRAEERVQDLQPRRPNWTKIDVGEGSGWQRGPVRVRELANELGVTQRRLLELCDALGIPARSKGTRLSEPYADMLRRRVHRGERARVPSSA
jgi:hypothetical protein